MSSEHIVLSFEDHMNEFVTTQDWTTDPDRIEVTITKEVLEKARRISTFLDKEDVSYAVEYYALGYGIFQKGEDGEEAYDGDLVFEGANLRVRKDGTLRAEFPSKYTSDALYIELGSIADIENKINQTVAHIPEQSM